MMTLVVNVRHGTALRYTDWQCMAGSDGITGHYQLLLILQWI